MILFRWVFTRKLKIIQLFNVPLFSNFFKPILLFPSLLFFHLLVQKKISFTRTLSFFRLEVTRENLAYPCTKFFKYKGNARKLHTRRRRIFSTKVTREFLEYPCIKFFRLEGNGRGSTYPPRSSFSGRW